MSYSQERILVAPLQWGLGHATRCVPLIKHLLKLGCQVVLASDGEAKTLLHHEFPELPCLNLPAYQISYRSGNMVRNIALQLPRLVMTVSREHRATQLIIREHGITGIISDNRYGVFSSEVPCVLITHQLRILSSRPAARWVANLLVNRAIGKFDEVWVPDYADRKHSLTGILSHGVRSDVPVHYIGPLSRMQAGYFEREYDVAIVLSGPEPQRSKLESVLLEQALSLPMRVILVQGKPNLKRQYFAADHVEVVSYLSSADLNRVINASKVMVCRSGYSSIMDLVALRKKALLIPTPGQTEQEYLAAYLEQQGVFPFQHQDAIALESGIKTLSKYTGFDEDAYSLHLFEQHLETWLQQLHA